MSDFHEGIEQPQPPRADISRLPNIVEVRAQRNRYDSPRVSYRGLERVEHPEAVEILVTTDAPFPVRALAPILYIGGYPVDHWEMAGKNTYRFFAFEPERLAEDAKIELGWPDDREPRQPAAARFRVDASTDS